MVVDSLIFIGTKVVRISKVRIIYLSKILEVRNSSKEIINSRVF